MILNGREEMGANPSDEAMRQLQMRYRLTALAAQQYHAEGFTVIVQDNYYGEQLPYFVSLFDSGDVQVIVLCPDAATIQQREQARGKTGYTGFEVEPLYNSFMQTTPRIGLWIDSSNQPPEETAARIYDAVIHYPGVDRRA